MTAFTPDLFDKAKAVILDKGDRALLLALILFFCAHATLILGWRHASIKDFENVLSWLVGAIVVLACVFVAGEVAKRAPRRRADPPPKIGPQI